MPSAEGTKFYHIDLWHLLWQNYGMNSEKKVTVHLPSELLEKARDSTGKGITETIRQGLELLAASSGYKVLQKYRGKHKASISIADLRRDRK